MKMQKAILGIVWIPVLLCGPFLNAAETKEYSNTEQASAMIRIQADPSFLRIEDYESFNAICKPAYLQAFHDLYGDQKNEEKENYEEGLEGLLATVDFLGFLEIPGPNIAIQGTININLYTLYNEYPLAAREIKEAFLERLKENINRAYEEYRRSLQDRETVYAKQVAEDEARMNALSKALLDISGGKKMSREFLEDQITGLSKELQEREFEISVRKNRLNNMEHLIQEATSLMQEKQASDPIPAELEKKVASLELQFQNMKRMAEAGQVSGQEMQEIEQHLIEARIELAERREISRQNPEAQRVLQLKEELTRLTLDFSEQQMRLNFLREQIDNVRSLLERSTEYETLEIRTQVQRKALYESMEQMERIRRENQLLTPPILTVISQ